MEVAGEFHRGVGPEAAGEFRRGVGLRRVPRPRYKRNSLSAAPTAAADAAAGAADTISADAAAAGSADASAGTADAAGTGPPTSQNLAPAAAAQRPRLARVLGRIDTDDSLQGIPGSRSSHAPSPCSSLPHSQDFAGLNTVSFADMGNNTVDGEPLAPGDVVQVPDRADSQVDGAEGSDPIISTLDHRPQATSES